MVTWLSWLHAKCSSNLYIWLQLTENIIQLLGSLTWIQTVSSGSLAGLKKKKIKNSYKVVIKRYHSCLENSIVSLSLNKTRRSCVYHTCMMKGKWTKIYACNYEVVTSCFIFPFIIDTLLQISDASESGNKLQNIDWTSKAITILFKIHFPSI